VFLATKLVAVTLLLLDLALLQDLILAMESAVDDKPWGFQIKQGQFRLRRLW
jgi:hypothetical protein